MKKSFIFLFFLCFVFSVQIVMGQSQAEKDRNTFISNAKLLEKKPFDPNAKTAREWGFRWLVETDAVSVVLCSDMMKLIPEKKNKFKAELLMQFSFGMAVFKLENTDKKDDESLANLAGLEGMLRTYETMVGQEEKAKNAELDAMLLKRSSGELASLVASVGCGKK